MKKTLKLIIVASVCALAALGIAACGGSSNEVSRSNSKDMVVEKESTVTVSGPINVLAVGNDSRYKTSEDKGSTDDDPSYSDTMMLMRIDPDANYISIISIPRDTAAEYNGQPTKINAVHLEGGIEGLEESVGAMFGTEIDYYLDLHFIDFANLIDAIGGVYVDVPMSLTGGDIIHNKKISLEAGPNELDGPTALMLSRQRKVYAYEGEAVRQMISRDIVANAIQAIAALPSSDAEKYADIIESNGKTDFPAEVLTAYIKAFMDNPDPVTFNLGTIPYVGGIDETGTWRIPNDPDLYLQLYAAMKENTPLTDLVELPYVA